MSGMSMGAISRTRKCSVDVPKNMKYMMMRADMAGLLCVRGGFYRPATHNRRVDGADERALWRRLQRPTHNRRVEDRGFCGANRATFPPAPHSWFRCVAVPLH